MEGTYSRWGRNYFFLFVDVFDGCTGGFGGGLAVALFVGLAAGAGAALTGVGR